MPIAGDKNIVLLRKLFQDGKHFRYLIDRDYDIFQGLTGADGFKCFGGIFTKFPDFFLVGGGLGYKSIQGSIIGAQIAYVQALIQNLLRIITVNLDNQECSGILVVFQAFIQVFTAGLQGQPVHKFNTRRRDTHFGHDLGDHIYGSLQVFKKNHHVYFSLGKGN